MAANLAFDILARDRASKTFDKMGKSVNKTAKSFDRFKTVAIAGAAAFGAFAVKMGKDSVKAFVEAEQAQTKLEDAFARFPQLADTNVDALRAYNEELAKKVRFDDDAIASGQAVLAQFKLTGEEIKGLTPLVADYAAKTGKDLPTAAKTLGKAFLGNTRALKELGINYKLTGNQARDTANIVELLRQKVGGFAEKEGKTAAGQARILSNQFEELQEDIGAKLIPVLSRLTAAGLKVVGWIERNKTATVAIIGVLTTLAITIAAVSAVTKTWIALQGVARAATIAWTAAQWALNVALIANPLGIVIAAIVALGAALVVAYMKSEKFRKIVNATFNSVKNTVVETAKIIGRVFLSVLDSILATVGTLINVFAKLPGPLGKPFKEAKKFIDEARGSVQRLQDSINGLRGRTVNVDVVFRSSGGGRAYLEGVRQHGGPVRMGHAYVVGEAGPEVFVPNRSGTIVPNGGGGGTIVFNFPNYVGSRQDLVRWLRETTRQIGGGDIQKAFGT